MKANEAVKLQPGNKIKFTGFSPSRWSGDLIDSRTNQKIKKGDIFTVKNLIRDGHTYHIFFEEIKATGRYAYLTPSEIVFVETGTVRGLQENCDVEIKKVETEIEMLKQKIKMINLKKVYAKTFGVSFINEKEFKIYMAVEEFFYLNRLPSFSNTDQYFKFIQILAEVK